MSEDKVEARTCLALVINERDYIRTISFNNAKLTFDCPISGLFSVYIDDESKQTVGIFPMGSLCGATWKVPVTDKTLGALADELENIDLNNAD